MKSQRAKYHAKYLTAENLIAKTSKYFRDRKHVIQKSDGENPSSNPDKKKSDSKKLLKSNLFPKKFNCRKPNSEKSSDEVFIYGNEYNKKLCNKKSGNETPDGQKKTQYEKSLGKNSLGKRSDLEKLQSKNLIAELLAVNNSPTKKKQRR